jgi:alcohol dehydrogenase
MRNFEFQNATKIIFGKETENKAGEEVSKIGKKALLHYGGGSIKKSGLYDRVKNSLTASGVEMVELGGVEPNPRLDLVQEGIELCRKENVDIILAVGGGSSIDSAKAIAIGVPYDGDVWDFFEGKQIITALPVGVVLTIPAAGSETSTNAVITNTELGKKYPTGSLLLRPKFAILNPELCYTLPAYQTACGTVDMFSHVMERYFSVDTEGDLTDRLCEATMQSIIKNALLTLKNPSDYASRAELMWASTVAHNGFLDTGRTSEWSSHMIEHELSAKYNIAHGAGLAIIFPAWIKYVYKKDVMRFAQFAQRVFGISLDYYNPERTVLEGIEQLIIFFKRIGMPTTLAEVNIGIDNLEYMAKKCFRGNQDGTTGTFFPLDTDDILNIYKLALK